MNEQPLALPRWSSNENRNIEKSQNRLRTVLAYVREVKRHPRHREKALSFQFPVSRCLRGGRTEWSYNAEIIEGAVL